MCHPWHPLGITSDLNEASPAIFIPGASHGEDMQPGDPSESREMSLKMSTEIQHTTVQWLYAFKYSSSFGMYDISLNYLNHLINK